MAAETPSIDLDPDRDALAPRILLFQTVVSWNSPAI